MPAIELAKPVVAAVVDRSGLAPSDFDDLVLAESLQGGGGLDALSMCAGGGMGAVMVIEVS